MTSPTHRPKGWPSVIPRIVSEDPEGLVDFIKQVFEADGDYDAERPSELRIDDSMLMVSRRGEREATEAFLYVYVADTDAAYERAVRAGATGLEPPSDMFYGDRRAMLRDPWGNSWQIATHSGAFK